jgi:hypothetical protein
MQDSEYERQQEIEYPMDTTWAWYQYTLAFANIASISFIFVFCWNFWSKWNLLYILWFIKLCFWGNGTESCTLCTLASPIDRLCASSTHEWVSFYFSLAISLWPSCTACSKYIVVLIPFAFYVN